MLFLYNVIIYSVLGFLFESAVCLIIKKPVGGNFTYGPYTLVYGISLSVVFAIYKFIDKKIKNKFLKYLSFFIISFILISLLEYSAGILLEYFFEKEFWNYSDIPFTYKKYINLFVSLFWSIASILIYKFLMPFTNKIFKYVKSWMINIMISLIFVDIFFSIISML